MTTSEPAIRYGQPDWWLLAITCVLLAIGLAMVFSASGIMAAQKYHDAYYFFQRQALYTLGGLVLMAIAALLPRSVLHALHYPALLAVFILLVATLGPFGVTVNGAKRWLPIGPFRLQAMEFAKIALVLYLAYFMSTKQELIKTFSIGVVPPFIVTGLMCCLLLPQPDFGGAVLLASLLFFMCLVGGVRLTYLFFFVLMGGIVGWELITSKAYRFQRILGFLNPFKNPLNEGYQLVQSLLAFGNGGLGGVGLGAGKQKLFYLPEAHTDFIMSVFAEEAGFVGMTVFFILIGVLFWRGMLIALRQEKLQDRFASFGILMVLMLSFVLNMAVVTSSAPAKGVPMPFLSYGGSSLLASLLCVGLLLNFSRTGKA